MLRNCLDHGIQKHVQIQAFYQGLTVSGKDKSDHLNRDLFLSGTTAECHNLLNNLVAKHSEKKSERAAPKKVASVLEADQVTTINAKIDFLDQSKKSWRNAIAIMASTTARFKSMKPQIGQLANMTNSRPQVSLPSNTETNSRKDGKDQCQAITLYNGRELQEVTKKPTKAKRKSYIKFMKDILFKRRRLGACEMITLTKRCSAIIQKKLPPHLKDPRSFTIPCRIGSHSLGGALCDLGASINLLPYCHSTNLKRIIEDALVEVYKFIFPADFIILDMEADSQSPIILERVLLAAGQTLADVQKGEIIMRVQDY
ncbi:hypothetical protein CDL12_00269 [Handroanthus impetiginosus]|uniref:Uncharacterized protein n=1 Tax=Handroanthus impetiginosus TaxID=429701 RepID=A0A2G9IB45_9LAMI|nr:hypothetical protein CDL12_00269 [Handroanthus impetiginosus]